MITEIPTITKLAAVIIGSGWLVAAEKIGDSGFSTIGGWGLAITGLVTLWRQAQTDKTKFDEKFEKVRKEAQENLEKERKIFHDSVAEERSRADGLRADMVRQNAEFTKSINQLTFSIQKFLERCNAKCE